MTKLLAVSLWLLASTAPAVAADLYQWTDARGVVHFTDNPQAIPSTIRNSGSFSVRKEFFSVESTRTKSVDKFSRDRAAPIDDATTPSVPVEPHTQPPVQVIYAPHESTLVVVNHQQRPTRERHPCRGERCIPAFRVDANDRRYIHPSVFAGGLRQYIRP